MVSHLTTQKERKWPRETNFVQSAQLCPNRTAEEQTSEQARGCNVISRLSYLPPGLSRTI
jgi:hypothetical protein